MEHAAALAQTVGYLRWIPLLPLIGAAINGLNAFLGNRLPKIVVSLVGCSTVFLSLLLAGNAFFQLQALPAGERVLEDHVYTWMRAGEDVVLPDGTEVRGGTLRAAVGFLADPLSAVMILVVCGIGFLIHLYSVGYMGHDPGYSRYFAYLNLFTFAMLLLVLGDNLFLMFVGWEGVGFCSYALISFWYREMPNAWAGMKAFIVNRVGDFGFIVGLVLLFWSLGSRGVWTVNFRELAASAHLLQGLEWGGISVATLVAVLLFVGACGKSAQIPLYVWLPDAMAGPTPVSALIHAATMVTAGVYMIGRMNFLYAMSPAALEIVATVGVLTALFAATIGLAQNDIKKVLAYSTVSQLGYMFLGMGVGAYAAGIFHLMTHAFFKGLLFLGAGSVIHAMSGEQDMRRMGGLAKKIPYTYWTFLAATIAICGIWPLAGFFSKDEILWQAWATGHRWHWLLGFLAAGLTAFYMFRLVSLTFWGENRSTEEQRHHLHESPWVMLVPLIVLAVLSVCGGWVGVPEALGGQNRFHHWLAPVVGGHAAAGGEAEPQPAAAHQALVAPQRPAGRGGMAFAAEEGAPAAATGEGIAAGEEGHGAAAGHAGALPAPQTAGGGGHAAAGPGDVHRPGAERALAGLSVLWAALAACLGFWIHTRRRDIASAAARWLGGLPHRLLYNKYYVDEIYQATVIDGVVGTSRGLAGFDNRVVDGAVNGAAFVTRVTSSINGFIDRLFVDGAVNLVANVIIGGGTRLRRLQTGQVQQYLYVLAAGVAILVIVGLFIL